MSCSKMSLLTSIIVEHVGDYNRTQYINLKSKTIEDGFRGEKQINSKFNLNRTFHEIFLSIRSTRLQRFYL